MHPSLIYIATTTTAVSAFRRNNSRWAPHELLLKTNDLCPQVTHQANKDSVPDDAKSHGRRLRACCSYPCRPSVYRLSVACSRRPGLLQRTRWRAARRRERREGERRRVWRYDGLPHPPPFLLAPRSGDRGVDRLHGQHLRSHGPQSRGDDAMMAWALCTPCCLADTDAR